MFDTAGVIPNRPHWEPLPLTSTNYVVEYRDPDMAHRDRAIQELYDLAVAMAKKSGDESQVKSLGRIIGVKKGKN